MRIAALGMAGRIDEAKSIGHRLLELEPGFRINAFKTAVKGFHLPEVLTSFVEGLGRAEVPE